MRGAGQKRFSNDFVLSGSALYACFGGSSHTADKMILLHCLQGLKGQRLMVLILAASSKMPLHHLPVYRQRPLLRQKMVQRRVQLYLSGSVLRTSNKLAQASQSVAARTYLAERTILTVRWSRQDAVGQGIFQPNTANMAAFAGSTSAASVIQHDQALPHILMLAPNAAPHSRAEE